MLWSIATTASSAGQGWACIIHNTDITELPFHSGQLERSERREKQLRGLCGGPRIWFYCKYAGPSILGLV